MNKFFILLACCFSVFAIAILNVSNVAQADGSHEGLEDDVMSNELHLSYINEALSSETTYSSNITEYDTFMQSYFDNLTYNHGVNYKGSCGYVAIDMLLSYYDSFLNDLIVPEQYEVISNGETYNMVERRNSPGSLNDSLNGVVSDIGNLSAVDYFTIVENKANESLHCKLITIGASLGYYNFSLDENNANPAATSFNERKDIINSYLTNVVGLTSDDYSLGFKYYYNSTLFSSIIRDYAIEKVQGGQPVLLSIGKGEDNGHVVVAYDYNETTDELFCHFGWGANKTHITIESDDFDVYRGALVINFNMDHSHTNNYAVTTHKNGENITNYYCYNDTSIILYNHSHVYTESIISISETQHQMYCECGSYLIDNHEMNNFDHCLICGQNNHMHNYNSWGYYNRSCHVERCDCGQIGTITQAHAVKPSEVGFNFANCIGCGHILDLRNDIGMVPICEVGNRSLNGSYILPNGVIVLVDEDILEYLLGMLRFYPNGDQINVL